MTERARCSCLPPPRTIRELAVRTPFLLALLASALTMAGLDCPSTGYK